MTTPQSAVKVQRYTRTIMYEGPDDMDPDPDGEWVKYSDLIAATEPDGEHQGLQSCASCGRQWSSWQDIPYCPCGGGKPEGAADHLASRKSDGERIAALEASLREFMPGAYHSNGCDVKAEAGAGEQLPCNCRVGRAREALGAGVAQ